MGGPIGVEMDDGRSSGGGGGGGGGGPRNFSFLSRCLEESLLPAPPLLFSVSSPSLLGRELEEIDIITIIIHINGHTYTHIMVHTHTRDTTYMFVL